MTTQYDSIAAAYQRTKESPLRRYVEAPSYLERVGDVRGQRVLDLACGDGFYARAFKQAGAAAVVGVDISADMLKLAAAAEAADPLGIEYRQADVTDMGVVGTFDLVSAAYLLHYAATVVELHAMCRSIAQQLAPGGRLVSINENPEQTAEDYAGYTQYGFNKQFARPRAPGSEIRYSMVSGRDLISFTAHYFDRDTYERALGSAGFRELWWAPLTLAPAGAAEMSADYFTPYLDNPPVVLLDCRL